MNSDCPPQYCPPVGNPDIYHIFHDDDVSVDEHICMPQLWNTVGISFKDKDDHDDGADDGVDKHVAGHRVWNTVGISSDISHVATSRRAVSSTASSSSFSSTSPSSSSSVSSCPLL